MSDLWSIDVTPSTGNPFPGEIPLYQRDCILLTDDRANDNDEEIIASLKEIKFDTWCTGPPQQHSKKRQHKSFKVTEQLLDIKKGAKDTSPPNDNVYRPLQRYECMVKG